MLLQPSSGGSPLTAAAVILLALLLGVAFAYSVLAQEDDSVAIKTDDDLDGIYFPGDIFYTRPF